MFRYEELTIDNLKGFVPWHGQGKEFELFLKQMETPDRAAIISQGGRLIYWDDKHLACAGYWEVEETRAAHIWVIHAQDIRSHFLPLTRKLLRVVYCLRRLHPVLVTSVIDRAEVHRYLRLFNMEPIEGDEKNWMLRGIGNGV